MKISIVTGPFQPLPPRGCGAVEKIWWALAVEFSKRGNEVNFIACKKDDELYHEEIDGVLITRLKGSSRTGNICFDLLKDLCYSTLSYFKICDSQITILNSFWLPFITSFAKRGIGKSVFNVSRFPKGQMKLYYNVDLFAAVSKSVCRATLKETPNSNVKVIPNPINTEVFSMPLVPRDYSSIKRIVYTGRVHKEKGIDLLLESFSYLCKKFNDIELKIVGPVDTRLGGGGNDYLTALKELAKGLPVEFVPPIFDEKEIAKYLQGSHFFCYPSIAEKGESFGVAALEAMGTGLPVVVSDLECFKDFIEDGVTGCVYDHRATTAVDNLTIKLANLIINENERDAIGRNGYEISRKFSLEEVATQYLRAFESLLAR